MCLYINEKRLAPTKVIKVYKVVELDRTRLKSPRFSHTWKPGINKSCGKVEIIEVWGDSSKRLHGGALHVFTSKSAAMRSSWITGGWSCQDRRDDRTVVVLKAKPEDFVAWGTSGEACFKKLHLTKTEHTRATRKIKQQLKRRKAKYGY